MGRTFRAPSFENFLKQCNYIERFKTIKEIKDYISNAVKYFCTKGVGKLEFKYYDNEFKEILEFYKNYDNDTSSNNSNNNNNNNNNIGLISINEKVEKIILSIIIQLAKVENLNLYAEYLKKFNDLIEFNPKITQSNYIEKFKIATFNYTSKTLNLKLLKQISNSPNFKVKNCVKERVGTVLVEDSPIKYQDFIEFLEIYFNQSNFIFTDKWMNDLFKLVSNGYVYFDEGTSEGGFKETITKEEDLKFDYFNNEKLLKKIIEKVEEYHDVNSDDSDDEYEEDEEKEEDQGQIERYYSRLTDSEKIEIRYKIGIKNGKIKTLDIYKFLILLESMMEKSKIKLYNSKSYLVETLYSLPNRSALYTKLGLEGVQYFINLIKSNIHPLEYYKFNNLPFEISSKQFVDFIFENYKFYQLVPTKSLFTKKIKSESYFQLDPGNDNDNNRYGDDDDDDQDEDDINDDDDDDDDHHHGDYSDSGDEYSDQDEQQQQQQAQLATLTGTTVTNTTTTPKTIKPKFNILSNDANNKNSDFGNFQAYPQKRYGIYSKYINSSAGKKDEKHKKTELPFKEIEIIKGNNITVNLNVKQQFLNFSTFEIANYFHEKLKQLQVEYKSSNKEEGEEGEKLQSPTEFDISSKEIYYLLYLKSLSDCNINEISSIENIVSKSSSDNQFNILFGIGRNKRIIIQKIVHPFYFRNKSYKSKYNLVNPIRETTFFKDKELRNQLLNHFINTGFKCFTPSLFCYLCELLLQVQEEEKEKVDYFKNIFNPSSLSNYSKSIFLLSFDILIHFIMKFKFENVKQIIDFGMAIVGGGGEGGNEGEFRKLSLEMIENGTKNISNTFNNNIYRMIKPINKRYTVKLGANLKLKEYRFEQLKSFLYDSLIGKGILPPIPRKTEFLYQFYYKLILQSIGVTLNDLNSIHMIFQESAMSITHRDFYQYLQFYWLYIKDSRFANFIFLACSVNSVSSFKNSFLSKIRYSGYIYFNYMFKNLFQKARRDGLLIPPPTFEEIYNCKDFKETYYFLREYFPSLYAFGQATFRAHSVFETSFVLKTRDFDFFIEYLKSRNQLVIDIFVSQIVTTLFEFITLDQVIEFIRLTTMDPVEIEKATSADHDTRVLKMWYGKSEVDCKNWLLHSAVQTSRLDIIKLLLIEDKNYSVLQTTKDYMTSPAFLVSIFECLDSDILRFFITDFINNTQEPEQSFFYKALSQFIYNFPLKNQTFVNFKFKAITSTFTIFGNGFEKFDIIRELVPSITFNSKLVGKCLDARLYEVLNYYYDIGVITNNTFTTQQKQELKSNDNLKHLNWVISLAFKKQKTGSSDTTTKTTTTTATKTKQSSDVKMNDIIAQVVPNNTLLTDLSTPQFSIGLKTRRSLNLKNVDLYKTSTANKK